MQLNRLRVGEILAGTGALGLFVMLFFDWFRPEKGLLTPRNGFELPGGLNALAQKRVDDFVNALAQSGWNGLGWLMVIVLLVAIVAAVTLIVLTVTVEPVGPTISTAVITTGLGGIATLVLLIRLTLAQPDLGYGLEDSQVHLMPAAYLGLLFCALIALGGWLTVADERTEASYSAPPELTPRPIPPTA